MSNVLYHPRFGEAPVINPSRPGRKPKGVITLSTARLALEQRMAAKLGKRIETGFDDVPRNQWDLVKSWADEVRELLSYIDAMVDIQKRRAVQ